MKDLTIKIEEATYNKLVDICLLAKQVQFMKSDKPIKATSKDVAKLLSFIVNDKQFNSTMDAIKELVNYGKNIKQ